MLRKLLLFLVVSSWLLASCIEEITDFKVQNPLNGYVVYGELHAQNKSIKVRIHRPTNYAAYDANAFSGEAVAMAKVTILENGQPATTLAYVEQGLYQSNSGFRAVAGRSYQVQIQLPDGNRIESSPEVLLPPVGFENIRINLQETDRIETSQLRVEATLPDPAATTDFYLIRQQPYEQFLTTCPQPPPPPASSPPCFSKCWAAPLNTQWQLFDDRLSNGRRIERLVHLAPITDFTDYALDVELLRVSPGFYNFWGRLEEQRTLGGSIFDKVPAQVTGNLTCATNPEIEVLGYFGAAATQTQRIYIERPRYYTPTIEEKLTAYIKTNKIRYPDYPLWNCQQAGWVRYNLGQQLFPLVK